MRGEKGGRTVAAALLIWREDLNNKKYYIL